MMKDSFVLRIASADRPGIVAAFSGVLSRSGGNITEAQQYNDRFSNRFFARVVFDIEKVDEANSAMNDALASFGTSWSIRPSAKQQKVVIFVSKSDHCLADILYRWRTGELAMDLVAIVSNHPREAIGHLPLGNVQFYHFPISAETKSAQEREISTLLRTLRADLVVLARYMQVLSDEFASQLLGRCINIHHSFLPGFKGARPYHQAHQRGVKLIGATAHYVTAQLDEGPIIEQDVERISHRDDPEDLVRKGRDIERRVLARALRYHLEDRIFLNGRTTVVFS